jgi:hypothetical protein
MLPAFDWISLTKLHSLLHFVESDFWLFRLAGERLIVGLVNFFFSHLVVVIGITEDILLPGSIHWRLDILQGLLY